MSRNHRGPQADNREVGFARSTLSKTNQEARTRSMDLVRPPLRTFYVMRLVSLLLASLVFASLATASSSGRIISGRGVRLVVPSGWDRVEAAGDGNVVDPRTLLVVGTADVRPRSSLCQIAAYRIPSAGAVVVVVGWKTATSGGGRLKPGRAPLRKLISVKRPHFKCFSGRGASAQLVLGGKAYQVNVMVGDLASKTRVARALAVARSFDLVR